MDHLSASVARRARHRLIVLVAVLTALSLTAVPATAEIAPGAEPAATPDWSQPGPGVVRNETGAPGADVYIVGHQAPSLARYEGGVAGLAPTATWVTGTARLDTTSPASVAYRDYLAGQHDALAVAIGAALGRDVEPMLRYDAVLNAFAVELTPEEASLVATLPGVAFVERNSQRWLLTDKGPGWINAEAIHDGTATPDGTGTRGEGVVVGIIDTGINTDHPSFAAVGPVDGYVHTNPRPTYLGLCDPVTGAPLCNGKLIGVYDFTGTGPEDANGHGSHTASTAAGNVLDAALIAPTITVERRISGVAPHANIISYNGCNSPRGGCELFSLLGAINQATLDMVDVVNYSIGGGSANPWEDLDAQAFFDAYAAGVFVATSAGNDGPGAATMGSPADAPWVTAVGASTHDRKLANGIVDLTNAGGSPGPADIFGKSVTAPLPPVRVVYAGDYAGLSSDPANANLCGAGVGDPATGEGSGGRPWPAGTFNGEIVVCDRGEYGRVHKAENVAFAGAGGYVLANDPDNGDSLVGDAYPIPGVHISHDDGLVLKAWIAANGGFDHQGTARIRGSVPEEDIGFGDVMASFSSRGPNPAVAGLIKPDVTAPGVDIFAAFNSPLGTLPGAPPEFNVISGTSMSSPHTAGAAALVRAARPDWSPDEVKSALMTTAFTVPPGANGERHGVLKEDSSTPADPFDMGSGRIDLSRAALAGFVLGETAAAYEAASPGLDGDPTALNIASLGDGFCQLACTWTRTLRGTTPGTVQWNTSTSAAPGVSVSVSPASFTLSEGETQTITITADVSAVTRKGRWVFADVRFAPDDASVPDAHFPVAVFAAQGAPGLTLHMHGNLHDGCTGDGAADLETGEGVCTPFLSPDGDLDTAPAASWGPVTTGLNCTVDRCAVDPNWVWQLDEETTLYGPMVVEWWYTSPNKELVFNLDFTIRLWADGELVVERQVRHNALIPKTELFRSVVDLPKITASDSYVLHIDPFFSTQNGAFIYYDSTAPCPGVVGDTPCDSRVTMPVIENVNLAPTANDDEAFVLRGESVLIPVLDNDTDPENDPLSVRVISGPAHGTAHETLDNEVVYTHDGSATSSDSFVYEITDTGGLKSTARVDITISDNCFVPAGDYADDFESGAPGWTVDTAVLTPPSATWELVTDSSATSGQTVWFADALAQNPLASTSKDVRLVSPAFLVSEDTHLTFFHEFFTEPGFDGGVLEVSTNGGASWSDVLDAGGVFVTGGYNDSLEPGSDFVLSGRAAWAGDSGGMVPVDVDLGALAGNTLQVRFRLGQDQIVGELGGWWIDDVALGALLRECGEPPVANDDTATVDAGDSVNTDVKANDNDPDTPRADLTVTIQSAPSHGDAEVEPDGTVTYTHNGDSATSDAYQYRITDPDGGFDIATVTITVRQPVNPAPDAVDDTATVPAGGSVTVDVKGNDSDPNHSNEELTVTIETAPGHGSAGVTADGQVTYTHNGDAATSDSFEYRLTDPAGAFDVATVTITIDHSGAGGGDKATGGGYLEPGSGHKINFGFNAKAKASGFDGHLTLNDKSAGVKIRLDTITDLGDVDGDCGEVTAGPGTVQFTGTGTHNGDPAAFRVCVADHGEPGNGGAGGADLFYLECTSGCSYTTGDRTVDDIIDGGNIQVHRSAPTAPDAGTGTGPEGAGDGTGSEAGDTAATGDETDSDTASGGEATVLILDPLLLTHSSNPVETLTVRAYDANGDPAGGIGISLQVIGSDGIVTATLSAVTGGTGLAVFTVVIDTGGTEYIAGTGGGLTSNAIHITPAL